MSKLEKPKQTSLMRSSALVGSMTFISRIMGLVRDIVFARYLGADGAADAFYIAFRIPNLFRRFFAEGAFSQAFVPVLSEYRQQGSLAAVNSLVNRVAGCLGFSLITLTLAVWWLAPALTWIFANGYAVGSEQFQLTTQLIRIMFPYLLLISLAGLLSSLLNSYDHFAVPAFTPVFLNLVLIIAAMGAGISTHASPVMAIAWGVVVAGVVQLGFQWPFVKSLGVDIRPQVDFKDPAVKRILALMAPALFGASVAQINMMLNTLIASYLPTGSVSWMYYSDRLTELPLGIFAVAIATVVLPLLSRQIKNKPEHAHATLDWGLRTVLFIALPATLALMVLAEPILIALFRYGHTQLSDVQMSAYSLFTYSLGLPAFMLIKVLASGFYARQDTRTPVTIGLWTIGANMLLNGLYVWPMAHYWQIGHAGLTLATATAALLNAFCLWRVLQKKGFYQPLPGWGKYLLQLALAAGAMVLALKALLALAPALQLQPALLRVLWVALFCVAGFFTYVATLWVLGLRFRHLRPATFN